MKTILTLIFCFAASLAFAQVTADKGNAPTPERKLTASDSVVSVAKFEDSVKKQLTDIDTKIEGLQKQFEELNKEKSATLKTFYGIYCEQKKLDQTKVTVTGVTKEGITIQTLK
jgi:hypothetical protein